MKKHISKFSCSLAIMLIVLGFIFAGFNLFQYYNYGKMEEEFISLLRVYDIKNGNNNVNFIRFGKSFDGGYVVPTIALEKTDALLGYGIADDISFEEQFSARYNKPSYGFDCGISAIEIKNELCHFIPECIATDKLLYFNQASSKNISTFNQQLRILNLIGKKLFIKMDIEGAEYEAIPEILQNAQNITSIVMELHNLNEVLNLEKAMHLLSEINKYFYLVHVHGNNCVRKGFDIKNVQGKLPDLLELTYINKNLVENAKISANQKHPAELDMPNCPNKPDLQFEILNN